LGDPEATRRTYPVIDGVRYAVPGDRARLRPDGSLEVLGRDWSTINTGGEKVFAEEVEAVLREHPDVDDALVVGRPSPRWGEEVVAVVAARQGVALDERGLVERCRAQLAAFKAPKAVVVVPALRRNALGKGDYRWARAVAAGAGTATASSPRG
jgi:fatty-acyl-CoA synthase